MANIQYETEEKNIYSTTKLYFTIEKMVNTLKKSLDDPTQLDMASYVSQLEELVSILQNTSILEPSKKEQIEKMAYQIIYDYMKFESIASNKETIHEKVKNGLIPTVTLARFIAKDLASLPYDKKRIVRPIQEKMEQDGLSREELVNKEFIRILAMGTKETFVKERWKQVNKMYANYQKEKDKLKPATSKLQEEKMNYQIATEKANSFLPGLITRFTLYALPFICCGFTLPGLNKETADLLQKNKKGIVTTYDAETETMTTALERGISNENIVIVEEIMPWEKEEDGKYHRKKTTYLVEKNRFFSFPDYIKAINNVDGTIEEETIQYLPRDYGYQENKYLVKYVNEDQTNLADQMGVVICYLLILMLLLLLSTLFAALFELTAVCFFDQKLFEKEVGCYREALEKKRRAKINLQETTKELKKLIEKCKGELNKIAYSPNSFLLEEEIEEEQYRLSKK